jgi:preprotein translocase subunit SecY
MTNFLNKNFSKNSKILISKPTKKILITLLVLFLFRFGNSIPLSGIDQEALKRAFLQFETKNSLMQLINMYSGGGGNALVTSFSLGIIPYINASILVDLFTVIFPFLEKLQSEEGEAGKQKLTFYKKGLTLLFALVQSIFLIFYLKPYLYNTGLFNLVILGVEFVTGSLCVVWLSNIIDSKGIGNGTSLIIFTNIVVTFIGKNVIKISDFNLSLVLQVLFLFFFMILICISQTARINIEVVSARQLAFLENLEKSTLSENKTKNSQIKENGLSIRLSQAGIFPIIIASNIIPFFSFLTNSFFPQSKIIETIVYYLLIVGFNYFYTIVFWDPEKIAEQLRKASVSIVNITPGQNTVSYLENVVRSSSIAGGFLLCFLLVFYEIIKQSLNGNLLNQINISSLIILVGVAYEVQKTIRALYKSTLEINV